MAKQDGAMEMELHLGDEFYVRTAFRQSAEEFNFRWSIPFVHTVHTFSLMEQRDMDSCADLECKMRVQLFQFRFGWWKERSEERGRETSCSNAHGGGCECQGG